MDDLDKYDLETIAYSTTGWNGILSTMIEKVAEHLHTRIPVTVGEAVSAYQAGYMSTDGKAYKAKANLSKMPALGLFVENGIQDAEVRLQRIGPITNVAWTWAPGKPVYLSPDTDGGLTQTPPAVGKQLMGIPETATKLILVGTVDLDALPTTTTTTTSSSSSSTSSSSTTTTTPP